MLGMSVVDEVIAGAGGLFSLAAKMGVSHQAVQKWRKTGVPPKRVLKAEAVSGVPRYRVRPDIYPPSDSRSLSTTKRIRA
jgi:DNA-binding transcriptional regulator YdaS (Cro superfamily)